MIRRLAAPLAVFVVIFAVTLSVAAIVRRDLAPTPPLVVASSRPSGSSVVTSPTPTLTTPATVLPGEPLPLPPLVTASPRPTSRPTPQPTPILVTCANGVDNSGGLGLICEVTVTPLMVSVRECHGAAGAPTASCSLRVIPHAGPVTVDQCNGSANGGGATLRCSVIVIDSSGGTATVNQCVGSGDGNTTGCIPLQATVGATITQCNGSANGGTLVGLSCTASGSASVTVNQCNGSGNGGGALVICSAET